MDIVKGRRGEVGEFGVHSTVMGRWCPYSCRYVKRRRHGTMIDGCERYLVDGGLVVGPRSKLLTQERLIRQGTGNGYDTGRWSSSAWLRWRREAED